MSKTKITASILALSVSGAVALHSQAALASDHTEAPAATALPSADVADYYVWNDGDMLNLIITVNPFTPGGVAATFDADILYTMHFDTTGDNESDIRVYTRFGQADNGEFGLQVTGIGDSQIVGPVETVFAEGDVSVFAGSKDDPFFFDAEGFNETVATGTLSFDPTRDSVAGLNVTAIVLQAPLSSVVGDATSFNTWVTTGTL